MKQLKKILIELAVSIGYPLLLSFSLFCVLFYTGDPDTTLLPGLLHYLPMILSVIALFGTIFYGSWDFDREPFDSFWNKLLMILLRIIVTFVLFSPFVLIWGLIIGML